MWSKATITELLLECACATNDLDIKDRIAILKSIQKNISGVPKNEQNIIPADFKKNLDDWIPKLTILLSYHDVDENAVYSHLKLARLDEKLRTLSTMSRRLGRIYQVCYNDYRKKNYGNRGMRRSSKNDLNLFESLLIITMTISCFVVIFTIVEATDFQKIYEREIVSEFIEDAEKMLSDGNYSYQNITDFLVSNSRLIVPMFENKMTMTALKMFDILHFALFHFTFPDYDDFDNFVIVTNQLQECMEYQFGDDRNEIYIDKMFRKVYCNAAQDYMNGLFEKANKYDEMVQIMQK